MLFFLFSQKTYERKRIKPKNSQEKVIFSFMITFFFPQKNNLKMQIKQE